MSLDERFEAAVKIVQKLPAKGPVQTSNDEKLRFYSLYKQSLFGQVNTPQPYILDFTNRAKWDAWNKLGNMSKEEAKKKYVIALQEMLEKVSKTMNVLEWLQTVNTDPELPKYFSLISDDF